MSNAVASRGRDSELNDTGIVIIIFALFSFLTLISDIKDIYGDNEQVIILYGELNYY